VSESESESELARPNPLRSTHRIASATIMGDRKRIVDGRKFI